MSHSACVMCDLAGTVNIMPVGKSLNKFGLLSKEIYHDLHKTNVNEGIKWRGLLHSINFQENKLARLALIELVRIENPKIADELEKPEYRRQIGCICGQSVHAPHLKRSNSLSHIMESSSHKESEPFTFGRSRFDFSAFDVNIPDPAEPRDDKWKYMSLQPMKSPVPSLNKSRRRSRSLEILRPFTAVDRQIYIPKPSSETSSEAGSIEEEIDYILAGISSLNQDYDEDQLEKNNNKQLKETTDSGIEDLSFVNRDRRLESEENLFSGFPSSSSVESVIERVSLDDINCSVFSESVQEHNQNIGSPDLESTSAEMDITSDGDVTMMSSGLSHSGRLQSHGKTLDLTDSVNKTNISSAPHMQSRGPMSVRISKATSTLSTTGPSSANQTRDEAVYSEGDNQTRDEAVYSEGDNQTRDEAVYSEGDNQTRDEAVYSEGDNQTRDEAVYSEGDNQTRDEAVYSEGDNRVLIVCVLGLVLLLAAALFFLPERLISCLVILVLLQLYTERRRKRRSIENTA